MEEDGGAAAKNVPRRASWRHAKFATPPATPALITPGDYNAFAPVRDRAFTH
jgi:hypothetical protein